MAFCYFYAALASLSKTLTTRNDNLITTILVN